MSDKTPTLEEWVRSGGCACDTKTGRTCMAHLDLTTLPDPPEEEELDEAEEEE